MIEYHDTLNPLLWDENNNLKGEIKTKLIEIYQTFVAHLEENKIPIDVIDVLVLGSNAAYNYTEHSDIDLHLVVDFSDLPLDETLTQIFYNNEKSKFNDDYDINIKGFPVEVYIENIDSGTTSNGIYSLLQDKWLKFPEYNPPEEVNYDNLLNKYKNQINNALTSNSTGEIKDMINEIKMLRKISLSMNGEYSKGNLVFKELRNDGTIDTLYDKLHELTSKELSLENLKLTESTNNALDIIKKLNELPIVKGVNNVEYELFDRYLNTLKELPTGTKFGYKSQAGYVTYEKTSSDEHVETYNVHIPPPYRDNVKEYSNTFVAKYLAGRGYVMRGPIELN